MGETAHQENVSWMAPVKYHIPELGKWEISTFDLTKNTRETFQDTMGEFPPWLKHTKRTLETKQVNNNSIRERQRGNIQMTLTSNLWSSCRIRVHSTTALGCLSISSSFMSNKRNFWWGYRALDNLLIKPKVYSSLWYIIHKNEIKKSITGCKIPLERHFSIFLS